MDGEGWLVDVGGGVRIGRGAGAGGRAVQGPACGRSMARGSCFSLAVGSVKACVDLATGTGPCGERTWAGVVRPPWNRKVPEDDPAERAFPPEIITKMSWMKDWDAVACLVESESRRASHW